MTWASFNWDCIFEASFFYSSGTRGYGDRHNPRLAIDLAGWRNGPPSQEYLKLHGSVGWWDVNGKPTYLQFGRGGELEKKWLEYEQNKTTDFPIILEPSAYKYSDPVYRLLQNQWDIFLNRLCEADYVLVIGYSLPDGDVQARSKILVGFQANPRSRWVVVDPSKTVCDRYKRILGQRRLKTYETGLAGFNSDLVANLHAGFETADFSDTAPAEAVAPNA